MRSTLASALILASATDASAWLVPGGPGEDFGTYNLSASPSEVVGVSGSGRDLLATTITVTNISGNPDQDINGIGGVVIGSLGALHHEQAPNPIPVFAYPTPLSSSFTDAGLSPSPIDSHFLLDPALTLPGGAPSETFSSVSSGVAPQALDSVFPTAQTGFGGVLTGSYAFASTFQSVDIAYLVWEDRRPFDIDIALRPTNGAGVSEDLIARIETRPPEPTSGMLAGIALVVAAIRRS